jgi:LuxR family maltose regulon positive regulatory protein
VVETDSAVDALQRHIIERPRLLEILEGATARIILLTAPAGYGKTTLARQWARRRPNVVWCSCTPASADPAALALTIAREIEAFAPDDARRIRTFLRSSRGEIDVSALADRIVSGMSAWPDGGWLFVDDHHLIPRMTGGAQLLEEIAAASPATVMMAGRFRPEWAGRSVLYGEAFELDAAALTMNENEVREVLHARKRQEISWFASAAGGWPALVGLASLTAAELPERWNDEVHDYFAREVFALLSPGAQRAILLLAIAPVVTPAVVEELLGENPEAVLREGVSQGFLTPTGGGTFVIHPLLLEFLRAHRDYPRKSSQVVDRLFTRLNADRSWDIAFALLKLHCRSDLLIALLRTATEHMLHRGQTPSLADWCSYARRVGIVDPLLDYIDSHLLLRSGEHQSARETAMRAANRFAADDPLLPAALIQAGWASYFIEQRTEAVELFRRARAGEPTGEYIERALWGELNALLYEGNPVALQLLDEYEGLPLADAVHQLRLATGRLKAAEVFGGLTQARAVGDAARGYLVGCDDPMVQTSFLNVLGIALALNAQYARARAVIQEAATLCEQHGLVFASRHLLIAHAISEFGLRRYARAASLTERMRLVAAETGDSWFAANYATLRARLVACTRTRPGDPLPDLPAETTAQPEYVAGIAFAHVATGEITAGLKMLESTDGTMTCEARALSDWTRVIAALTADAPHADNAIETAWTSTYTSGHFDALVRAYRARPQIASFLSESSLARPVLKEVMARANDRGLARAIGIEVAGSKAMLTVREREVIQLITEGLSNREIGNRLFISPVTVKVHLRHAYEKLGVRTRTEAALRASADESLGDL